MSEGSPVPPRRQPEQNDKFIPPPMDPYATYQTPYERRAGHEPNPFIEFRRFADKQFSDMFSSFPGFGPFSNIFGSDDGMKQFKEQLEKDMKDMLAQNKKTEELLADKRSQSALSAQEHSGPSTASTSITAITPDGKRYSIDPLTGRATEQTTQFATRPVKEQDSPRERWKRGFKNCPELSKYQGETELDVYESQEEHLKSHRLPDTPAKLASSWSSWLPMYGYDGKEMIKRTNTPSHQDHDSFPPSCKITTYYDRQSKRMDPFWRDRDFLPWLFLSQYSPLMLANPGLRPLKSVKLHNECKSDECTTPARIVGHEYLSEETDSEGQIRMKKSLAEHLAWADAFEDLVSLDRTGKMPDRGVEGQTHPREVSAQWVRDMVGRGLLGPNWKLENNDIVRLRETTKQQCRRYRERHQRLLEDKLEKRYGAETISLMSPDEVSKLMLRMGSEETLGTVLDSFGSGLLQDQAAFDKLQQMIREFADPETKNERPPSRPPITQLPSPRSVPNEADPKHLAQQQQQPPTGPVQTSKPSIISTLTTRSSRTLPDGSVETKQVLKKRFADGLEESEESTEIIRPQLAKSGSAGNDKTGLQKSLSDKPGWFWT